MRLTSMSAHSRLQKKKKFLETYRNEIERLCKQLGGIPKQASDAPITDTHLVIIIGSQKGLCGAFNNRLMQFFEKSHPYKSKKIKNLVSIGKKITEYFMQRSIEPMSSYDTFNPANFVAIAHEITQLILDNPNYSHVTIYSNNPRTFFIQETTKTSLAIPREKNKTVIKLPEQAQEYTYEEPVSELRFHLEQMYMKVSLEELLFKSLIAEQAARFVSMDTSTHNADQLITDMQRDYNKLRQALITRELTDLAGGIL